MNQTIREQVAEFHNAIGAPILLNPTTPSSAMLKRRLQLVGEEFAEFCEALGFRLMGRALRAMLHSVVFTSLTGEFDMPAAVDACADIDYTVEGTRLELGVYGPAVAAEVHAANMRKIGGPQRADGKQMKPQGWRGPDISGVLKSQGWIP